MLSVLRCPNCSAPIESFRGHPIECRYCGATLVAGRVPEGPTEDRFTLVLKVAPSNRDRVARLLHERLGILLDEARALVGRSPVSLPVDEEAGPYGLAREVADAGADARVEKETVAIPMVRVILDEPGPQRLKVITLVRANSDLSVSEAKAFVGSTPRVLVASIDERRGRMLVEELEGAGARARIER